MTYDQRFPNMREYRSKLELDIYRLGGLIEGLQNEGRDPRPLITQQEHDRISLQELEYLMDLALRYPPAPGAPPRLPIALPLLIVSAVAIWLLSTLATYFLLVRI